METLSTERPIMLLDILRRRWRILAGVILVLGSFAMALAFGLPAIYRSKAVILIEQQEVPQDFVRSLVTSFAEQRLQTISQRVLTSSNLSGIIEKYALYEDDRKRDPMELVIEKMRDEINVKTISADVFDPRFGREMQATIAFELAFVNESPALAQRVTNELVTLFLNENLKSRAETAELTLSFLDEEAGKLQERISELESRIATFKSEHADHLPELEAVTRDMLNRSENELSAIATRLGALRQERAYLESELLQQKPTTGLFTAEGQRVPSSADRLKIAEVEFTEVSARYGPDHPDVLRKAREIEGLRKEMGNGTPPDGPAAEVRAKDAELEKLRQQYSAEHPDVRRVERELAGLLASAGPVATPTRAVKKEVPDNPLYMQTRARLEANQAETDALLKSQERQRARIEKLESNLSAMPQVEREYRQLARDYDTASAKYQEVVAKRQEADLARNLETEQKGERFTLIEPPVMPELPASPNRHAIGIVGMLLAFAGGFGGVALREMTDPAIYGRLGVIALVGVPPIAVIPEVRNLRDARISRRKILAGALLLVGLLLAALTVVHFVIGPLDVLWFRAVRKFGF